MKKSTKVVLGVLGVLATIDLVDICAKGQTLSGFRSNMDEDPYELLVNAQTHKLPKVRVKMITKVGKIFDEFNS